MTKWILLLLIVFAFCGCDEDPECDERHFPYPYTGYYLFSQHQDGEEMEIVYTNGKEHYVVWYSEDECDEFTESEFQLPYEEDD